jgi:hypothetical protein
MLNIPISVGEGLDKLSIIEIKLKNVKDESRRKNVEKEFNVLVDVLIKYKEDNILLYNMLKNVNIYIWELMDILRDGNVSPDIYAEKCRETIIANDIRFRIKDQINHVTKSVIKEQKGYQVMKTYLMIKNGNTEEIEEIIKIILYYLLQNDELYVESDLDEEGKEKLGIYFKDFTNIKFNHKEDDDDIKESSIIKVDIKSDIKVKDSKLYNIFFTT